MNGLVFSGLFCLFGFCFTWRFGKILLNSDVDFSSRFARKLRVTVDILPYIQWF